MGDAAGATGGTFFSLRSVASTWSTLWLRFSAGSFTRGVVCHEAMAQAARRYACRRSAANDYLLRLGLVRHPPGRPEETGYGHREARRRRSRLAAWRS